MKTTDSVKDKFIKWLAEESGEPEHLVMLMQSVYINPEKLWKFYSQAEARRREERDKDWTLAILEVGESLRLLKNIKAAIGWIHHSPSDISQKARDLLTKIKEEE